MAAVFPITQHATRIAEEGRVVVLDGSTVCPHPILCTPQPDETFGAYVERHLRDHQIDPGVLPMPEDRERNLYLWCFFAFHRYGLENRLLTPQPFWEDHEFLANWTWHEDDLEMNTPMAERTHQLRPAAERRSDGEERRFKKLEKPRETLKTTEGFALATWEHLRAFYVRDTVTFRVTVISSTRALAKKRYILAAEKVWGARRGRLFELFYGWEEYGPEGKKTRRKIGLIHTRGAVNKIDGSVTLRWLQDTPSTFATHSMIGFGAMSESVGERADLTICDDLCTGGAKGNSNTFEKREKIKNALAEQEKQLEHGGRMIWFDTRKHLDDASGTIDKEPMRRYWHTLHRKAYWYGKDGNVIYYWPVDGLGKPRITEEYLAEQKAKHGERDFWNELMNEPQDPDKARFRREWFVIVHPKDAPLEVTAGLGKDVQITEEIERLLEDEGLQVRAYSAADPAGSQNAIRRNDDTGLLSVRFDRESNIWITLMSSGKWPDSGIKAQVWDHFTYNSPRVFYYEAVHDSGVEDGFRRFQQDKGKELGVPVLIPLRIVKPSTVTSKTQKIDNVEPFARRGAIRILSNAGSPQEIEKFITQHTGFLIEDHDEYPDVLATIIKEVGIVRPMETRKEATPSVAYSTESSVVLPIGAAIAGMMKPKDVSWGRRSGRGA